MPIGKSAIRSTIEVNRDGAQAAGLDNLQGILSTAYLKDPTDPTWKDDPALTERVVFMEKYYPEGDRTSTFTVYGYSVAQSLVQVLKKCGDKPYARAKT